MTELTAHAVEDIMKKVLYRRDDIGSPILVEGIMTKFGFNLERLKAAKPEIDALLAELPKTFRENEGGGWTFLNACVTRHGKMWGQQREVEMLVALGIGVGSAEWLLKDMADVMPGGVPYFKIHVADKES